MPRLLKDEELYAYFLGHVAPPDQAKPGPFSTAKEGTVCFGEMSWCVRRKGRRYSYYTTVVAAAKIVEKGGTRVVKGYAAMSWYAWIGIAILGFVLFTVFALSGDDRFGGPLILTLLFFWPVCEIFYDLKTAESFLVKFVAEEFRKKPSIRFEVRQ